MVMDGSILHVVPSLAHPKLHIPTSISLPVFMVSAPAKITFFHTLEKPPLTEQVHVVSATQPRAALEKEICEKAVRTKDGGKVRQDINKTKHIF